MAQIHEPPPPNQRTERIERPAHGPGGFEPDGGGMSAGRIAAVALMLVAVTLVAAGAGFLLAGGRLPSSSPSQPAAVTQPDPAPPTGPTLAPPTAAPTASTAPSAPTVVPTAPPKPTAAPAPTAAPKPTEGPKPTDPPPARPIGASPPAPEGVHSPARPGIDARTAQIEGRVNEYFAALRDEDYARAQQVCCTPDWRARFPLERWQRNFEGVSDLRLVGAPRYQKVDAQEIVVDTDYTFVSGGARRSFTLRWTFKPVGSEWQADLAEAFPTAQ